MKTMQYVALTALLSLSLPACQKTEKVDKVNKTEEKAATHDHEKRGMDPEPVKSNKVETRKTPTGGEETLVGGKLTGAPRVKVAELMDKPDEHVGKLVALEGNVGAMCHHRKLWFSVIDDDTGRQIRVITAPAFITPEDSIGRKVRVEGVVEKIEIPAARAKHIAKEHKTADPDKITGDVHHEPILRGKGAVFN